MRVSDVPPHAQQRSSARRDPARIIRDAVAEASRRTRHAPDALPVHGTGGSAGGPGGDVAYGKWAGFGDVEALPPAAAPDPRYTSADPAVAALWRALTEVMDPEIPISLVDLGLIYGVRREGARVEVDCTFTATACPCMAFIREDIQERLLAEAGVTEVVIHEVWDPPWSTENMTEHGRARLRACGISA
ncbi:MAG: metal-sulfur cluster assembly factor [Gemmatimonadota bacterium]